MTIIVKVSSANGPVQEKCIVKEGIITDNKVIWKK
jgi:hypothetical protein